jgi:hypothetical protein
MNETAHSKTAAALYSLRKLQAAKAMARTISTRMKASLTQKDARRMRCSRKSITISYTGKSRGEKVESTGSKSLVLPANENGRNNVSNDEEQQKDIV